jgi:hypothetical protein
MSSPGASSSSEKEVLQAVGARAYHDDMDKLASQFVADDPAPSAQLCWSRCPVHQKIETLRVAPGRAGYGFMAPGAAVEIAA